jgi:hypothetical protein
MARYHLDPRDAGSGKAPSLVVAERKLGHGDWYWITLAPPQKHGPFATVDEALRAARIAAGLGDVPEKPCKDFLRTDAGPFNNFPITHPGRMQCARCAWAKERHAQ